MLVFTQLLQIQHQGVKLITQQHEEELFQTRVGWGVKSPPLRAPRQNTSCSTGAAQRRFCFYCFKSRQRGLKKNEAAGKQESARRHQVPRRRTARYSRSMAPPGGCNSSEQGRVRAAALTPPSSWSVFALLPSRTLKTLF